jgi:S-adenosylmethionine:tRNA ribosyltransferase-isomerase
MPLKKSDFRFDLPDALIAQAPAGERTSSRLLVLDPVLRSIVHDRFANLLGWLEPDDLLVINDTRVVPARLFGVKDSGGRVELLIERIVSRTEAWCLVRASKPLLSGRRIAFGSDGISATVVERRDDRFRVAFSVPVVDVMEVLGHVPLPPYIARADEPQDRDRYQTVYAAQPGAVAAPTAGLHFDAALLDDVAAKGVRLAKLTLHVGAGTFQPMRSERIEEHRMHSERLEVSASVVDAVSACRSRGGRVVAVGTTVVRALEAAAAEGTLQPFAGETEIFIYPGYRFRVVDALITNFHLPESTLLMLVSALAGREFLLHAYAEAVAQQYRFFSYGDAMLLTRRLETHDAV